MNYIKIAQTTDMTTENKKKISIDDRVILLLKIQDTYYAIDNTCPHMGGSLYDGKLDGYNIVCPRHGSTFDVRTGKNVQNAKMLFVKIKVSDVHNYPVQIEGTDILIGIE